MCNVSALAFALGMFIPLELNLPLIVGGLMNWYVTTHSADSAVNSARGERGTLIASGFIASGALMGGVDAMMRFGSTNIMVWRCMGSHKLRTVFKLLFQQYVYIPLDNSIL
jgi:uncharacterized oligopeptide transporter (OPT) family protein